LPIRGVYGAKKKAEYVIESYHAAYPAIRRWQAGLREYVKPRRYIHDALGRRRTFIDRMDDHLMRVVYSTRPQSTIVGITNIALGRLHEQGRHICAQVHDSILTETSEHNLQQEATAIREAMTYPIDLHGRTLTIPVDIQYGKSWGELAVLDQG